MNHQSKFIHEAADKLSKLQRMHMGNFLCYVMEYTLADIAGTKSPHQNSVLWVKNCLRNAFSLFCTGDRSLATPQTMHMNVSAMYVARSVALKVQTVEVCDMLAD
jgi:hypothetical protein